MPRFPLSIFAILLAFSSLGGGFALAAGADDARFEALHRIQVDGNYAEAYDGLRQLATMPATSGQVVAKSLGAAIECLRQLNRVSEIDAFRDEVLAAHADNWRVLAAAANSFANGEHYGSIVAGKFERGPHRGAAQIANSTARDRVRALNLFRRALELAEKDPTKEDVALVARGLATALCYGDDTSQYWRLQSLTDLGELPDYEEGWGHYGAAPQGAPVDADGNPIFYSIPASWEAATNDGERWRWALETMVKWDPSRRNSERSSRAEFLLSQFGVQTLADVAIPLFSQALAGDDGKDRPPTWQLDTLGEDETIARLATGIKRFKLPDDQNYIKLFQLTVGDRKPPGQSEQEIRTTSLNRLGSIFENRRQYNRAAEYVRILIEDAAGTSMLGHYQGTLAQIVGNWGQFEGVATQPAGRGATVEFRFRNARKVEFIAQAIDVEKLLNDVKQYIESEPDSLDWQKLNIADIGYRLVQDQQTQYLGKEVARWSLDLEPRDKHFDRRITVTTPLQEAGAYLVTAKVADGNTSQIVLWLADTAIVRKPMDGKSLYYVADAVSGEPIAKSEIEFFGYRLRHVDARKYEIDTQAFAEKTDGDGLALLDIDEKSNDYQWLAVATTSDDRLAYLGFANVWHGARQSDFYTQTRSFVITDRPVYRPEQTVQFKVWIARAQYDQDDKSPFAHQAFQVEIQNPKGEKVYNETLTADNFGGLVGKLELPANATLGQYYLTVVNHGGGGFRVEEYKKPEFEVTVEAPAEPVMLGEKITATIRAKYYFGSPVTNATLRYKVLRTPYESRWFPPAPWDWLYGSGYWWFGYDYQWLPGWRQWGCFRPRPPWWIRPTPPPEVVAEREAKIGPDGTLAVEIDTSLALAARPDQDHRYEIQAEVVDESRRTIVGSGEVLVARQPFRVFAWVDRGYYRVGDTINASFAARRLDGRGVSGTGKLRLVKLGVDAAGESTETEVRAWELNTNDEGQSQLPIKASDAGQYRLSYSVSDKIGRTIEGGYVFTIVGEGFDGSDFRFSDLELVPDKREYAPGERVQLQVNTNRVGSTVLLFVRPANGMYVAPQTLRLKGKSTIVPIEVATADMPNFFVEAVTIADGRVHTETREICVPPATRILNVDIAPSAAAYQPGQDATVKLKLTDDDGKPFVGSMVVSIYDKSVEYIAGASNVEDIREAFWKWQRQHQPYIESNLERWSGNLVRPGDAAMRNLGIFGDTVADEGKEIDVLMSTKTSLEGTAFGGGEISMGFRFTPAAPMAGRRMQNGRAGAAQMAMAADGASGSGSGADEATPFAAPTLRSEFADTALWVASLDTNTDGLAEVALRMPENLTTWRIRVWAMGPGTRVGEASSEVVTRKNVIVRMQAPRFFVEGDEVVLSANVHNYLPVAKHVKVRLEQTGEHLELPDNVEQQVEIPAGGERRVDWRVRALREGEAVIRMGALTDQESDAVEMTFPVLVHGMLKMESYTGVLRPGDERGTFEVNVPSERRAEQTKLAIRYSPTLAGAMVDALPYLVDYPYGCTEQTLNRFLPAVITQKTLLRMGLDLKDIQAKRTNLNAQEIGDDAERAAGWKRFDRNPVFDDAELAKIVKAGVQRLAEMQLSDGGWGWFSGYGEHSTPHTTATVVRGLLTAKANDVAIPQGVIENGVEWLRQYQADEIAALANVDADGKTINKDKPAKSTADNLDAFVYMVLVDAGMRNDVMRDYLYRDRTKLAVYALALFGNALERQNDAERLAMVLRNLQQFVVEDAENQTAYLNIPQNIWWYWYGSEYEAQAYFLKLLVANDPQDSLAPKLVKYLVNNRKHANYWNSTRDTALVVEAMADFIKATGEDKPDLTVEVWIDGQKRQVVKIDGTNLFTFDNRFVLKGGDLEAGRHTVELRKHGTGPLYYNGYLTSFTLEDDIRAAGLELRVERHYYRLTPADKSIEVAGGLGQVVDQKVEKYNREEIPNLGVVNSGDLVEVELTLESKNDYEYIIFDDMKAAGCEPVALQSGYGGNAIGAYMELRDESVTFFLRQLARGRHSVSYRVRAEIPGRFSALPTKASAMYAPELNGNSDELKLRIEERAARSE